MKISWVTKATVIVFCCLMAIQLSCGNNSPESPTADKSETDTTPIQTKESMDELLKMATSGETKSLDALLKLRDVADERAIPAMEKLLEKHIGSGNVFGFAAAQVLFCIGTEKAHAILSKHLSSPKYSMHQGITYAFYWEMEPSKRNAFIKQYHIQNTASGLSISVTAKDTVKNNQQKIVFMITLKNISEKPVTIYKPHAYLGSMLLLCSSEGSFGSTIQTTKYKMFIGKASFVKLSPGKMLKFDFTAEPRWIDSRSWKRYKLPQPNAFVLDCGDMLHAVEKAGKFTAYAFYSVEERFAQGQGKRLGLPGIWVGRVVSKPIEINIFPVKKPASITTIAIWILAAVGALLILLLAFRKIKQTAR